MAVSLRRMVPVVLAVFTLVFGLTGRAHAAYTPDAGAQAGTRMQNLHVLNGRPGTDPLALSDGISRAELVTIVVRAFGKGADARLLNGTPAYPDSATHWASGNIAMARHLVEQAGGDSIALPDGTFNPDGKLTPAQAIAFLMKFLGIKADTAKAWPDNYLDKAVEMGLITAEDMAVVRPKLNDPANRGLVFYLYDHAFYNYGVGAGKTVYTTYVDTHPPALTVDAGWPVTTSGDAVTLKGKVSGATALYVGSAAQAVTPDANGTWSAIVPLQVGVNQIPVRAVSLGGNASESPVQIVRTGAPASIKVTSSALTLKAGAAATLTIAVLDSTGVELSSVTPTVSVEGGVGVYQNHTFTAATKPAAGRLIIGAGTLEPITVPVTVTPGDLAQFNVSPSRALLEVGGSQKFTVVDGEDRYHNAVPIGPVKWVVEGGSISADGTFTATRPGFFIVAPEVGRIYAKAAVSVLAAPPTPPMTITPWFGNGSGVWTPSDNVPRVKVANARGGVASVKFELRDLTGGGTVTTLSTVTTPDASGWYWSGSATPALTLLHVYEMKATATDNQSGTTVATGNVVAFDPATITFTDYPSAAGRVEIAQNWFQANASLTVSDWSDANKDGIVQGGELLGVGTPATTDGTGALPPTPVGTITGRLVVKVTVGTDFGFIALNPYDKSKFVFSDNVSPAIDTFAIGPNGLGQMTGIVVNLLRWTDANSNGIIDSLELNPLAARMGARGSLSTVELDSITAGKLVLQYTDPNGPQVRIIVGDFIH